LRFDTTLASDLGKLAESDNAAWSKTFRTLAELVQFRHDMHKAIKET
jgi:hypothetical protein